MRPSAFATRPRRLQHVQRRRRDLLIACVHSNAGQAPAGRQAAPAALDLVLGRTGLNRMLLRSYHSPLNARARKAGSKASNSVEISFQAHPKKMTALFIGTWNDLHGVPGGGGDWTSQTLSPPPFPLGGLGGRRHSLREHQRDTFISGVTRRDSRRTSDRCWRSGVSSFPARLTVCASIAIAAR